MELQVTFQSLDGEVFQSMSIEVDAVSVHSSVAGDDLEMLIVGHTVLG